jgi:porin
VKLHTPSTRYSTEKCFKSLKNIQIRVIENMVIASLAFLLTMPVERLAAQDASGKAPGESEELFEQQEVTGAEDPAKQWLEGETATGTWGGVRTKLAEEGITFEGGFVADFLALTSGGASGGGNWDYAGYTYLGINFDLETLAGLPGLSFYVEGGWSFGEDLGRKTGSVFSPAQAFTGRAVRLSRMYLQQDLADDELTLKIGRLATEDDFLSSPVYGEYVSAAINSVPGSILESTPGFSTFPAAQWGAVAAYKPLDQVRAAIGLYSSETR